MDEGEVEMTERAVLFAALQKESVRVELIAEASEAFFDQPMHKRLFRAIAKLHHEGTPFDTLGIHRAARQNEKAQLGEVVLDADWLHEASTQSGGTVTVESLLRSHLPLLREARQERDLRTLAIRFMDKCGDSNSTDLLTWLTGEIDSIVSSNVEQVVSLSDADIIARVSRMTSSVEAFTAAGPLTSIPALDKQGFRITPGQLISIVGRPGEGKSLLMTHMALGVSTKLPAVVYALEDGVQGWLERRIPMITHGGNAFNLRANRAKPEHYERHSEYLAEAKDRPLYVANKAGGMSVFDIIASLRRLKYKHPDLAVAFIDQTYNIAGYLDVKRGDTLTYNIARIIDHLLRAASDLNIGIVLLQHVKRDSGVPGERDIADSDAFAKKSRKILICSRDRNESNIPVGDVNLLIPKWTHGGPFEACLAFDGPRQRLDNWVDPYYDSKIQVAPQETTWSYL